MSIINNKRLRDYPRIFFVTIWVILAIGLLFRDGWQSIFDQIIGSDFVTLYAAGMIHRTDLPNLYNFTSQYETQQALIEPTKLPGLNPYISPPYVAFVYSIFTYVQLPVALILYSVFSLLLTLGTIFLLIKKFSELINLQLSFWQLAIIILSFFPWIEGFLAGQNHSIAFFLVTCIVLLCLSEKWAFAGIVSGFLIYKPQLLIGFLIIWIIWRKFKAIGAFVLVSSFLLGIYLILYGFAPVQAYLQVSNELLLLPYIPGFPGYLLLTFYGLFATVFPITALTAIRIITTLLSIITAAALCWLAYKLRHEPILYRTPAILLAITLPLIATPYVMLHDVVVLIPGLILWNRYNQSRGLLYCVIAFYLSGLFLTLFATISKVALVSFITIGVVTMIFAYISRQYRQIFSIEAA